MSKPPVYGLGLMKVLMVLLALGLFAVPWVVFLIDAWDAKTTPDLNDGLVHVANLSAGVLSSAFAIALGVKVGGGMRTRRELLRLGDVLAWPSAPDWTKLALSLSVWLYFIVGAGAIVVYLKDTGVSPEPVRDFALLFAGYAAAYLAVVIGVSRR